MSTNNVRHLSVRVPWHDRAWDGHVCNAPLANSSCLALKLIAENRRDTVEEGIAGQAFDGLPPEQVPPCLKVSASFLSPAAHSFESVMAYSKWSKDHAHIRPRTVHIPAWGASVIPYRWMLKESGFQIAADLELDASAEREPEEPEWLGRTSWVQSFANQEALLDGFADRLAEEESLILFYATRTPLCDDERRVLLGAALLNKKHDIVEYPYKDGAKSALRAMVWERSIQHSLRPARGRAGLVGGFVMPYHAALEELQRKPDLDPVDYVAFTPEDARIQFSYGSEHVSHGAAAAALLSARAALERTAKILDGPWEQYLGWIDGRLSRLWTLQGPAPGLGAVLSALHDGFNGTLFAIALADELKANADPWPVIDAILSGKRKAPKGAPNVTGMLRKRWERIKADNWQLDFLRLLARFELTKEQAARAVGMPAKEVLRNPYLLYENERIQFDPISFAAIDRGLYPGKEVSNVHRLPKQCNVELTEYDNAFRLRAACVEILESEANEGNTLLPVVSVSEAAKELPVVHAIPLDAQTIDICRDDFAPVVSVLGDGGGASVQLDRYLASGRLLRGAVEERIKNVPKQHAIEWRELVDEKFGLLSRDDADEDRARAEKSTALQRLAASRFGVLIGPAGTGKTTVLQLLLSRAEIVGARVRLLAPTGKARVRLGQETGRQSDAQTVAQFLLGDRFDPETGRYFTNAEAAKTEATTCIVDESSMLTEDMLAAIVDALPKKCRIILVGDPYQLPPIGAGCPFVDIIEYLKRSHDGRGVAELTTPRRQADVPAKGGAPGASALARSDVQLAAIFSGRQLPPGEDEIAVAAFEGRDDETVKYRRWETTAELAKLVEDVVSEELGASNAELPSAVELSLGGVRNDRGYINFGPGCSEASAAWQILCLNRNLPGGSLFLNRRIKDRLRSERLRQAVDSNRIPHYRDWMRYIKPRGAEQIVYADKVICVRNHSRDAWVYATKAASKKEFVANGEIGMVTGQMQYGKRNPSFTHVEFSGRGNRNFSFRRSDFTEDGRPYLELAYSITVHKAQGSEFGTVILVLPSHSRLISREMLYTALTRQKKRIWILHQGSFDKFLSLRHYVFSDIAARFTNLLRVPSFEVAKQPADVPAAFKSNRRGFLQEKLIHRTIRGEMVSSKGELAIANILTSLERDGYLTYHVEPRLPFDDGRGRWADFMIEAGGETWYWEHCGMLADENYRKRWERKKVLYANNGYTIYSDKNVAGRLIVTEDGLDGGLDSKAVEELARRLFVT